MVSQERLTEAQRRAIARAAVSKTPTSARNAKIFTGSLVGLVAVGIVVYAAVFFTTTERREAAAKVRASRSAAAAAEFPQLPKGADKALKKKPTVTAGTGDLAKLTVTPLIEGKGPTPAKGQTVTINYVGVLYKTGEEFDSSWKREEPFSFALGVDELIPGFDQGMQGLKVGSRAQLDIPADLAYGDNPRPGQPAGPLRFVVDVLGAE